MQGTQLYSVTEAAKLAGVNPVTVRRHIRKMAKQPEKKDGRYQLTLEEVQKLSKKSVSTQVTPSANMPDIEPMQDLLAQINATFVQFSEQNAVTAQNIAQEYTRSVKPIVQRVTGEANPETSYDALRNELMEAIQRPMHRMITNMLVMRKAVENMPELENMPLQKVLEWFLDSMMFGLDKEGMHIPEQVKQGMIQAFIEQANKS